MSKLKRQQIRKNRIWKHFLYWCNFKENPPFINLQEIQDYDPEKWRTTFELCQEQGRKKLTSEELLNIKPILDGQRQKEIFLNGIITESMEFWAMGYGWMPPLYASFKECSDRLTKVAIGKIIKNMYGDKEYEPHAALNFFLRTSSISERIKSKLLALKFEK